MNGVLTKQKLLRIQQMVSSNTFRDYIGFLVGAALIAASIYFAPKGLRDQTVFITPPPHMEYFSFGYQMVLADSIWIRSIQDLDYCDSQITKDKCHNNSWLFQMLNTLTTLAPDYKMAYTEGGVALSVLISDAKGASEIYAKGIQVFPDDFSLLYRAGLHAWYEEKNNIKAANLYLRAARAQGLQGTWLYSLATRLYTDAGQREVALKLYNQMKEEGLEEQFLKRMRKKLGLPEDQ